MTFRRALRVAAVLCLVLLLAGGAAVAAVYHTTTERLERRYELPEPRVKPPTDPEAAARGRHLVEAVMSCGDCHGADLGGKVMIPGGPMGVVAPPNLTPGRGSAVEGYAAADWERAIRHGVARGGRPLFFMPSQEYYAFSDEELGAVIAYLASLPPVDREVPPTEPGPLARLLLAKGDLRLAAEEIAHDAERPDAPPPGPTREYGAILVNVCLGCHGADLAGGPIPGVPPDWPAATNISPDPEAGIGRWSEEDFRRALREGRRPDGTTIDERMPWRAFARMTDEELHALWLYLRSAAPVR